MYDAWKAGLILALAQLGYSDLLVTAGDPNDPTIKAYVEANPEWDSSLFLHISSMRAHRAATIGEPRVLTSSSVPSMSKKSIVQTLFTM